MTHEGKRVIGIILGMLFLLAGACGKGGTGLEEVPA